MKNIGIQYQVSFPLMCLILNINSVACHRINLLTPITNPLSFVIFSCLLFLMIFLTIFYGTVHSAKR